MHLFDNQVTSGVTMRRYALVMFLVSTFLMSSISGCLGLLQARETIEGLRDDVYTITYPDKVDISHTFETINIQPYQNFTSFPIDDSVERIEIYFKVVMSGSDTISCIDDIFTKTVRYVSAEVKTPSGDIVWAQDVCEDVSPNVVTLESNSSFETGDWGLDVDARGWSDPTDFTPFADNFIIIITVYRVCEQYPIEPACDRID